jgi:prevent-host-death family protein
MSEVNIRELRNHGGRVIDRVNAGERITITRGGRPVAELRPIAQQTLTSAALVERWRRLPPVDAARLRADLDALVDPAL